MKPEDTVMQGRITSLSESQQRIVDRLFNKQAKASFEAGRDSILAEIKVGGISVIDLIQAAKRDGIKEVVEWMIPNFLIATDNKSAFAGGQISLARWQAKLQEWGIDAT